MEGTLLGATTLTPDFFTVMPYADNGDPHGHCPVLDEFSISGLRPHEGASIRKDLQSFYCVWTLITHLEQSHIYLHYIFCVRKPVGLVFRGSWNERMRPRDDRQLWSPGPTQGTTDLRIHPDGE